MGEKWEKFARDRQAIAQAPGRLDELKQALGQLPKRSISGLAFGISQQGGDLALGRVRAVAIETDGAFKIRFGRDVRNQGEPYAAPNVRGGADWSLSPIIENDQFKWVVAERHNQAFTNDELADEVAIQMTKLIKTGSE